MQLGALSGAIYSFCNWFYRLAFINVLWIVFTLIGLVIFGLFPATIAMLSTVRQFINHNDVPVFSTFLTYYKNEFTQSNKLGLVITSIGLILFLNIRFLQINPNSIGQLFYFSSIVVSCLYFLIICYLLASYVEFNHDIKTHIKNAILLAVYNPLSSFFIIFGFGAVYFIITINFGLAIFFSASLLGLVILSSAKIAYRKIEKKQAKLQT